LGHFAIEETSLCGDETQLAVSQRQNRREGDEAAKIGYSFISVRVLGCKQ